MSIPGGSLKKQCAVHHVPSPIMAIVEADVEMDILSAWVPECVKYSSLADLCYYEQEINLYFVKLGKFASDLLPRYNRFSLLI